VTDAQQHVDGAALVVLGATGDLAQRKLYPAIASLAQRGQLPPNFCLVGVARTEMSDDGFREECTVAVQKAHPDALDAFEAAVKVTKYVTGSFDTDATWAGLASVLDECDRQHGAAGNRVFYLSTLPQFFETVMTGLSGAQLNQDRAGGHTRIVIEKPFGHDLASARELNTFVHHHFEERQIFRIDHYLGKETVQNLLLLRFTNGLFEPIWNRRYVDHVQILVAETLGVEGRGAYYDTSGALRDMLQNHMMQLLCLVAMEPPISFSAEEVRNEKVKVLHAIKHMSPQEIETLTVRGQYGPGFIDGKAVPGYAHEPGVPPNSTTDTFAAARFEVENWRWAGVPFYLRTGKRLPMRTTEITIEFRRAPLLLLPAARMQPPNRLVVHVQPDERISLHFHAKCPGPQIHLAPVEMTFAYSDLEGDSRSTGYETLLYDCMIGDATSFHRADMIDAAWRIATPILEAWAATPPTFPNYAAGTWGPAAAEALIARDGRAWLEPSAR